MGDAAYDFEPHYVEVAGHRMHYLDEGEGDPMIFLHGNPNWTYGWRNIVPPVSRVGRVIAPDMIGMGRSDKPELPYSYFLHLGYLEQFIDNLGLDRYVLVVHDWGSALGMSIAMRRPQQVRAMVLMETFTVNRAIPLERQSPGPWSPELWALCQRIIDPAEGPTLVLEQDAFNDSVQTMTKRELSDAEMAGYRSAYPNPESRLAQLRWPFQVLGPDDHILGNLREFARHFPFLAGATFPRILLHCDGGMVNDGNIDWYRENLPGIEYVHLGPGYHYIQEDQPQAIADAITAWVPKLPA